MTWNDFFGQYSGQTPYVNPSQENALPEVGQAQLLDLLGSVAGRDLAFGASLQPRSEQSLLDALNAMDPANDLANGRRIGQSIAGQGRSTGAANASMLRRRGFGQSAQAGAEIDARNKALAQSQDALIRILDPSARAQKYFGMRAAGQSPLQSPALAQRNQGYQVEGQRRAQDAQMRGGGFLGDLLGMASQALPYISGLSGGGRGITSYGGSAGVQQDLSLLGPTGGIRGYF